jgi:hypothetical protein
MYVPVVFSIVHGRKAAQPSGAETNTALQPGDSYA